VKIYLASSWRNHEQPAVVRTLRGAGHDVYDFRHPPAGDHLGFAWEEVDPEWRTWSSEAFRAALDHPVAQAGFRSDFGAMKWAEVGVLLLPCGRSAHLEAGYFVGARKPLVIVLADPAIERAEAELMYSMADRIVLDVAGLVEALAQVDRYLNLTPTCTRCGRPVPWTQADERGADMVHRVCPTRRPLSAGKEAQS
jgi:hypothetical protein